MDLLPFVHMPAALVFGHGAGGVPLYGNTEVLLGQPRPAVPTGALAFPLCDRTLVMPDWATGAAELLSR